MTTDQLIAVGAIAVPIIAGAIGWFATRVWRIERQVSKALTREEHERICIERNTRVEKKFDELHNDLQRQRQEQREALAEIRDSITGTHRRLDAFIDRAGGR